VHEKSHDTTEPTVTVGRESGTNTLLVPLFGCHTDHAKSALAFERALGRYGTVLHTEMPHVGVSAPAVGKKLIEIAHSRPETERIGYGHSYGSLMWLLLGRDTEFREGFGRPNRLFLECGFASWKDLSYKGRFFLDLAAGAQPLYGGIHNSRIGEPLYSTADKRRSIHDEVFEDGSLEYFADEVILIQPRHDPYVNNKAAQRDLQRVFGCQKVHVITDTEFRPSVTHGGASQFPEIAGSLLAGNLRVA
jgi:hypothetical protein